jgi:NADPH2 dehydrogenase
MSTAEVDGVLDEFYEGARLAAAHGFQHVQVHAAHGYLLNLLIDHRVYVGSDRILARLGDLAVWLQRNGVESSIRISLRSGDPVHDASGPNHMYEAILALPFDFIDISSGFYNINKQLIYPSRPDTLAARRAATIALAIRHPEKAMIISGRAMSRPVTDLPPNLHIGLCRDLIANPRFLTEPGNGCRNHGKCHYFSRGETHVVCPRWQETAGDPVE